MNKEQEDRIKEIIPQLTILEEGDSLLTVQNRFSGETVTLTPMAEAMYSWITGCEAVGKYEDMQIGLQWFRENYPKEYMILLD